MSLALESVSGASGPGGNRPGSDSGVLQREPGPRSKGLRGPGRLRRAVVCALLLLALAACRTTAPGGLAASARESAAPELAPAFAAAAAALEAEDDELARRILAGLLARGPKGRDLDTARHLAAVLAGRDLVRDLGLQLRAEPSGPEGSATTVVLAIPPHPKGATRLELGAPALVRRTTAIDVRGDLRTWHEQIPASAAARFEVPQSGPTAAVALGEFHSDFGPGLAVREEWSLEFRSGAAWDSDGQRLPIRAFVVKGAERTRVAAFLPKEKLSFAPLCELLARADFAEMDPDLRRAQVVERAVRIPSETRAAALDALGALLPKLDDTRVEDAAPALAWLACVHRLGNASGWRDWFAHRERVDSGRLDLPHTAPSPTHSQASSPRAFAP